MSFQARHARKVMAAPTHLEHLEVRQASPSASSGIASATQKQSSSAYKEPPQPTSMIALTATFTPPKTCFDNRLSMLPPRFEVWANAPVPVADITSSQCYPPEFLQAYTAVEVPINPTVTTASSVVPAMSGLVCPANYCTQIIGDDNYAACCPSDYLFSPPSTTVDRKRPAYGGTCYSPFANGQTYTITQFDTAGDTVQIEIATYTSGQNAYANPIDGFAASGATPVVGCSTDSSSIFRSSSSSKSSSATASLASSAAPSTTAEAPASSSVSKGTIAGASVAAVAGLAGLIFLVWFILRCVRRRKAGAAAGAGPHHEHELADTGFGHIGTDSATKLAHRQEKEGSVFVSEMPSDKYTQGQTGYGQNRVNDGDGPYEIAGDSVPEMDGGYVNKNARGRMADPKIGFAT